MKRPSLATRYPFLFSSFCCFSFRLRSEQDGVPDEDTKKYVKKKKKPKKIEMVKSLSSVQIIAFENHSQIIFMYFCGVKFRSRTTCLLIFSKYCFDLRPF